jgi:lysyl-tRNA synthetase class 2
MLEAYEAYGDYESMMELVQGMVCHVAQKVLGTLVIEHRSFNVQRSMLNVECSEAGKTSNIQHSTPNTQPVAPESVVTKTINLTPPWRRVKYKDLICQMFQKDWFEISRGKRLERAIDIGIDFKGAAIADLRKHASLIQQKDSISQIEWDRLVDEQQKAIDSLLALSDGTPPEDFEVTGAVFEKLIEPMLIQPTFVTHLPKELVPLAKLSPDDPTTVEVFECCINGQEIAPAYTEQNDPIAQRERLEHQAGGEQQKLDEDFLVALEHGMPPAGGMGMGIDRLCMMLLGQESIRDVILFPQLKPK